MWPSRKLTSLLGVEHPIVQAPMAGSNDATMALAVSRAGALGSIPCAMLSVDAARTEVQRFRQGSDRPLNLNFFCHSLPEEDGARLTAWTRALAPYYAEHGLEPPEVSGAGLREPFDESYCALVEELAPEVVSFHFGLPDAALLDRVKARGCRVLASATTAREARWLEERGADAIIAQGCEAGGHRGIFLDEAVERQPGTFALVPQVADAVSLPVIAAGGIADERGILAAFALGADGVQIGTAFLRTPESKASALHKARLAEAADDSSVLTTLFTGRPARSLVNRLIRDLGPRSPLAPAFPLAGGALAPLRKEAEGRGQDDFSPLWAGQAVALAREEGTEEVIRRLVEKSLAGLSGVSAG